MDESTRIHISVSKTTADSGTGIDVAVSVAVVAVIGLLVRVGMELGVVLRLEGVSGVLVLPLVGEEGEDRWRHVDKRSRSIYDQI